MQPPEYTLTGDSFNIPGRGLVITATLLQDTTWDALGSLKGTKVTWEGKERTIVAIEAFAIMNQRVGKGIGLLLKPL